MNSSIYWFIHPWGLRQQIIMWICDALCVSLCLVCALVVRRVRAAMAEEEEEEAAATPSLRELGNNHNASFTADKNLPRSTVTLSKSRSRKCRTLQVLLSFALSTSYASKPTSFHALLVRCLACDDRFSSLSSIFFRFLKPNWYLSLSLFRFRFSLSSL